MPETTTRTLIDRWNGEAFTAHCQHDFEPETCDYCYVRPMLGEIHDVYQNGSDVAFEIIYSMQDGYGEVGYVPDQGYDWSGVRDSTPATVRRIWEALHA